MEIIVVWWTRGRKQVLAKNDQIISNLSHLTETMKYRGCRTRPEGQGLALTGTLASNLAESNQTILSKTYIGLSME